MSLVLAPAERSGPATRLRAALVEAVAQQHGRFAPWLVVALGTGVVIYFQLPQEPDTAVLWLFLPLALLAAWAGQRMVLAGWALGLVAAGLLGFGVTAWHAARLPPPLDLPSGAVIVTGRVAAVETLPEGRRLTLAEPRLQGGDPLPRHLRIRLRAQDPTPIGPGDEVRLRALLRPPAPPVVPGGWDFQRAAYFSGLGGSGTALGPVMVEAGGEGGGFARTRTWLEARIQAAIPGGAGAVAAALVSGTQSAIPPADLAAMRDSGLAHLLSVSGLHMTIVMGSVFSLVRLLVALLPALALRMPGKPVAALASLAAGAAYMLLTGSQVPMQRCLVMATLVTLGLLCGRRALTLRTLALAAAVVVLAAPAELLGPSFQMSFGAVLALAAGYEAARGPLARLAPGQGWRGWRRRLLLGLLGLMLTSLLAGLATAPYGLHHFGRLQIYGLVANAVAVPLTSVLVMPAGMAALLLMPLGLDAAPLWAMGQGVEAILWIARQVAAWPEAAPVLPPLPGPALAVASLGFCWLALWRGRARLVGLPVVLGALAAGMGTPPPDLLVTGDGRMIALRTGQGVFVQQLPGVSAFARDAVLRQLGAASAQALPEAGEAAGGAILCTPAACSFRPAPGAPEAVLLRTAPPPRGQRYAAPPDAAALALACGRADLLLAAEPIRPACPHGATIDRFTVWRGGPHAVRLRPGRPILVSDRAWRGERPWVPPPPLPGRPESLPLAPRDPGGAP